MPFPPMHARAKETHLKGDMRRMVISTEMRRFLKQSPVASCEFCTITVIREDFPLYHQSHPFAIYLARRSSDPLS